MQEGISVGMLIPPEVSAAAALKAAILDVADHELAVDLSDDEDPPYDEVVAKLTGELREMIFEVADEQRVRFEFHEYQVYHLGGDGEAMGKRRRIDFLENDLLVTIDPTPLQCAMIGKAMHPRQRIAAAFTQPESLYGRGRLLSMGKVPLFDVRTGQVRHALQRAFLFLTPVNDDDRALSYQSAKAVVAGAFAYPNTRPVEVEKGRFTALWNPEENGSAKP